MHAGHDFLGGGKNGIVKQTFRPSEYRKTVGMRNNISGRFLRFSLTSRGKKNWQKAMCLTSNWDGAHPKSTPCSIDNEPRTNYFIPYGLRYTMVTYLKDWHYVHCFLLVGFSLWPAKDSKFRFQTCIGRYYRNKASNDQVTAAEFEINGFF